MSLKKLAFKILFLVALWLPLSIPSFADELINQDEILVDKLRKSQFDQVINLINRGGNPNAKDKYGWSLLHVAAGNNNKEIIEFLLNKGADINSKNGAGISILHTTADVEMANLLISKGADINARDEDGRTALHWAANHDRKLVAELLIAKGADINVKDKIGMTPRVCAFVFDRKEIRSLLKKISTEKKIYVAKVFGEYVFPEDIAYNKDNSAIVQIDESSTVCKVAEGPADWLDKFIINSVRTDFINKNGLKATDDEIIEMQKSQDHFMAQDRIDRQKELEDIKRKLKNLSLSQNERKNLEDHQKTLQSLSEFDKEAEKTKYQSSIEELREINAPWIEIWKFNKAIYLKYGGIVGITKFGPVPAGALKSLLDKYNKQGFFEIYDKSLEKAFWKKYSEKPKLIAKPEQIDFTPFWKKDKHIK